MSLYRTQSVFVKKDNSCGRAEPAYCSASICHIYGYTAGGVVSSCGTLGATHVVDFAMATITCTAPRMIVIEALDIAQGGRQTIH